MGWRWASVDRAEVCRAPEAQGSWEQEDCRDEVWHADNRSVLALSQGSYTSQSQLHCRKSHALPEAALCTVRVLQPGEGLVGLQVRLSYGSCRARSRLRRGNNAKRRKKRPNLLLALSLLRDFSLLPPSS